MAKKTNKKANQLNKAQDMTTVVQKLHEARIAIAQYKVENPDINVEAILSEHKELLPTLDLIRGGELDKFIAHAKEQGTAMPFEAMEMGVLAAGRKDMQDGLSEILNSLKFDKPICSECDVEKDNLGRGKKNF